MTDKTLIEKANDAYDDVWHKDDEPHANIEDSQIHLNNVARVAMRAAVKVVLEEMVNSLGDPPHHRNSYEYHMHIAKKDFVVSFAIGNNIQLGDQDQ